MNNVADSQPWLILIVDDESGLHDVSKLVLKRMSYGGRPVKILSAHSAVEARAIIQDQRDFAVALVDVVMEDDQAGLALVRDMRTVYGMTLTRIILRTGNPGLAPEREVIEHFQIDDYRDKTELTADRLYTSVYTALRAYETLAALDRTAKGLACVIKSVVNPSVSNDLTGFVDELVKQLAMIMGNEESLALENVMAVVRGSDGPQVIYGLGQHAPWVSRPLAAVADHDLLSMVERALEGEAIQSVEKGFLLSIESIDGEVFALWIPVMRKPEQYVGYLLTLFFEKIQMSTEKARLHREILDAQRTALSKLCEAVEMRSKETGQHIQRMAKYSRLLAELCGLPRERVELLEAAAPLHDIGKVAIPDAILKKAGSLTPDEMDVMRSHAQNGWDLLSESNSEMLQLGAEIALTHHERWDGTGYPKKLKGEEIPLLGRIVSLADVFDALMSKRVYKEAFSYEKTAGIIKEGSGKAFDPRLVELLLAHGDRFEQIFRQNPDQA